MGSQIDQGTEMVDTNTEPKFDAVTPSTSQPSANSSTIQPSMPTMMFAPPAITAALLPRPDTINNQSAEEWFKIFRAVADNLIEIYRNAGQEIVGQRQALATIPSLLNRTEGEKRLSFRILSECQNLEEAEALILQTVGDLETECQAAESIFNLKRGDMALEDFYALLVEKDRKARLGRTTILKKFISELPDGVKVATQKQFKKVRGNLELTKEEVDRIYGSARQFYQEKYGGRKSISPKTPTELVLPVSDTQLDMPMASETVEPDPLSKMLDEKLETYFADRENRYKKETRRSEQRKRNTPRIQCHLLPLLQEKGPHAKGLLVQNGDLLHPGFQ